MSRKGIDFEKMLEIEWESITKKNKTHEDHMIKSLIMYDSLAIENVLNLILIYNFIKEKQGDFFLKNALYDESFNVGLKIKIIARSGLLNKYKIINKLKRMFEIRNMIAHDTLQKNHEVRTRKEKLKLRDLYEEFSPKFREVFEVLYKISKKSEKIIESVK